MKKVHINAKGVPATCRATKGNCPFGADEHFDNVEQAQKFIDSKHAGEYGVLGSRSSKPIELSTKYKSKINTNEASQRFKNWRSAEPEAYQEFAETGIIDGHAITPYDIFRHDYGLPGDDYEVGNDIREFLPDDNKELFVNSGSAYDSQRDAFSNFKDSECFDNELWDEKETVLEPISDDFRKKLHARGLLDSPDNHNEIIIGTISEEDYESDGGGINNVQVYNADTDSLKYIEDAAYVGTGRTMKDLELNTGNRKADAQTASSIGSLITKHKELDKYFSNYLEESDDDDYESDYESDYEDDY